MKHSNRAVLVEKTYEDVELKALISASDVALGARYHFNVFAAACHVPFVGIASGEYQMKKLRGLANLCELPDAYVAEDLEFCQLETVWSQIERMVENRASVQMHLREVVPKLKAASWRVVEHAAQLLEARNPT